MLLMKVNREHRMFPEAEWLSIHRFGSENFARCVIDVHGKNDCDAIGFLWDGRSLRYTIQHFRDYMGDIYGLC